MEWLVRVLDGSPHFSESHLFARFEVFPINCLYQELLQLYHPDFYLGLLAEFSHLTAYDLSRLCLLLTQIRYHQQCFDQGFRSN